MKLSVIFLAALLLFVSSTTAHAKKMYRWVGADGRVTFSQSPPPADSGIDFESKERSEGRVAASGVDAECCRDVSDVVTRIAGGRLLRPGDRLDKKSYGIYRELERYVAAKRRMGLKPYQIAALASSSCMSRSFAFCVKTPRTGTGSGRGGSGSGFAISARYIVTNHHVVDGCARVTTHADGRKASVLMSDEDRDLALLRSTEPLPAIAAISAAGAVRLGEAVTVAGFPLSGMLAEQLNVTRGDVSSLAGVQGNDHHFQLSAPIQPGNSGGPVLDQRGRVVGVVVARLSDRAAYQASGALPQNVNFAIRLSELKTFLQQHEISFQTLNGGPQLSQTALAERAMGFTIPITCHADA